MYAVINALMNVKNKLSRREEGVTALEYGLIASLIAVVIIAAVTAVGTGLVTTFNSVSAKL